MPKVIEEQLSRLPLIAQVPLWLLHERGISTVMVFILLGMLTGWIPSPMFEQAKINGKSLKYNERVMTKTQELTIRHLENSEKRDVRQENIEMARCLNTASDKLGRELCVELQDATGRDRERLMNQAVNR